VDLTDIAETLGIVKNALLILVLAVLLLVILLVWRKVASVLDSTKRIVEGTESVVTAISSKVAGPAAAGYGVAFGAGKIAAFLTGFAKKSRGDDAD
jgi:hypothetical protein